MNKLSFLIAGVQKAGTSALRSYLGRHPGIWMGNRKEVHFFDNERLDWTAPPDDDLRAHMAGSPPDAVCGEATPIYTFWPPSPERIARYNPDMKIVVLLREPASRAYSHWAMAVERGHEKLSFSAAIREGRNRYNLSALSPEAKAFSYVERGLYANQINRLFALFPREQILLLRTHDLRWNHGTVLDRVIQLLGVGSFPALPAHKLIVPRKKTWLPPPMSGEDRLYLQSVFAEDLSETRKLTGLVLETAG